MTASVRVTTLFQSCAVSYAANARRWSSIMSEGRVSVFGPSSSHLRWPSGATSWA